MHQKSQTGLIITWYHYNESEKSKILLCYSLQIYDSSNVAAFSLTKTLQIQAELRLKVDTVLPRPLTYTWSNIIRVKKNGIIVKSTIDCIS